MEANRAIIRYECFGWVMSRREGEGAEAKYFQPISWTESEQFYIFTEE